jgi:hypothetical protein
MMIVPLILMALVPLHPALFLRELIGWLLRLMAEAIVEERLCEPAHESPGRQDSLSGLVGSLLQIEDLIRLLIHVRARQRLGLKVKGRWPGSGYGPMGHPRSLDEIVARFRRAVASLNDAERLAEWRARTLKRLLDPADLQLGVVHHPVDSPPTAALESAKGSTCQVWLRAVAPPRVGAARAWTLGIRAPP